MSLVGDVLAALALKVQAAVPVIGAGDQTELGWRPAHQLKPEELPHLFLYNESEQAEKLIAHQLRVTVSVTGLIVRKGSTHAQALADYEALSDQLEADPLLSSTVESSLLTLDGIEREEGRDLIAVAFSFVGVKVL